MVCRRPGAGDLVRGRLLLDRLLHRRRSRGGRTHGKPTKGCQARGGGSDSGGGGSGSTDYIHVQDDYHRRGCRVIERPPSHQAAAHHPAARGTAPRGRGGGGGGRRRCGAADWTQADFPHLGRGCTRAKRGQQCTETGSTNAGVPRRNRRPTPRHANTRYPRRGVQGLGEAHRCRDGRRRGQTAARHPNADCGRPDPVASARQ
mmetsp:Transcript_19316/g.50220  ORF Transcript_19316/g.50220 Transcript_19316/m.50220 type:complete len:203 (+) Transcript_19316:145-753(+)